MGLPKRILFLLEESPSSHIRFFEGLRMALGFSVSHPGMEMVLMGMSVRVFGHVRPGEIGLPPEFLEFFPLFDDLDIRIFADRESLSRYSPSQALPSPILPIERSEILEKIRAADILIPFGPAGRSQC
jgi:sulfur relay (sulfurtransferase) DsrF/TusC family protein